MWKVAAAHLSNDCSLQLWPWAERCRKQVKRCCDVILSEKHLFVHNVWQVRISVNTV